MPLALRAFALCMIAPFLVLTGCSSFWVNRFAFHPERLEETEDIPLGSGVREIYFSSGDGTRLHACYLPRENSQKIVLFLHGNAGHAFDRLEDARRLADCGAHVFLLSYRGYGKSAGSPSESGVYQDGRAALEYMQRELGFPENRIFILGRSLGSAVAMEIAQGRDLAGLILVTPLSSGRDFARAQGLGWLLWLVGSPFDSTAKAPEVTCPALVIHGDRDTVIPWEHGRTLYEALPTNHKRFHTVPGAGHNNLIPVAGVRYWNWITAYLRNSSL